MADTINTKGYNPNPNAGLYDNKQFKEGGDHLEDPLAKEDFEVSFYSGESRASEGSKASIYDTKEDHNEDSAWNLHSWDIDTGNGMRCGVCGIFEMYNGYNRKPTGESRASELGIGSTFNMSGSASDIGEQEFWCRHIGTGGIKCGEPFPEHFNGNIEDHDFYPIAQSTQDQMDGKLNESKASETWMDAIMFEKYLGIDYTSDGVAHYCK